MGFECDIYYLDYCHYPEILVRIFMFICLVTHFDALWALDIAKIWLRLSACLRLFMKFHFNSGFNYFWGKADEHD